MKQQPDKLFRDKLANESMPAPEAAWARIESKLPAQRTPWLYLKIAASFILILGCAIFLWPADEPVQVLSDNTKPADKSRVQKQNETSTTQKEKLDTIKANTNGKEKSKVNQEKNTPQKNQKKSGIPITNFAKAEHLIADNSNSNKETSAVISDVVANSTNADVINSTEQSIAETSATSLAENSTIVLVASDVSKYLKEAEVDDATSDLDNTSSFRKLLEKAADLKNNQSGLAELRQKKNEILALNFRNEKRERNN